jgi:hypothetical protein
MPRTTITHVLYETASTSRPGITHTVAVVGEMTCTCEDNQIRKRDCRHVRAYLRHLRDDRARMMEQLDRLETRAAVLRQRLGV